MRVKVLYVNTIKPYGKKVQPYKIKNIGYEIGLLFNAYIIIK